MMNNVSISDIMLPYVYIVTVAATDVFHIPTVLQIFTDHWQWYCISILCNRGENENATLFLMCYRNT